MHRPIRSATAGFTLIEVLIVLGIAALIMLVMFMVVPTMNRNSRNNQRKHDVQLLDSIRQEYNMTYNAQMIAADGWCTPSGHGGFTGLCGYLDVLTFYKPQNVRFINNAFTPPGTIPNATEDTVISSTYLVCDGNTPTTVGASSHSVAIIFALEMRDGSLLQQCSEGGVIGR